MQRIFRESNFNVIALKIVKYELNLEKNLNLINDDSELEPYYNNRNYVEKLYGELQEEGRLKKYKKNSNIGYDALGINKIFYWDFNFRRVSVIDLNCNNEKDGDIIVKSSIKKRKSNLLM